MEKHWKTQYCLQQFRANYRQVYRGHISEKSVGFCLCTVDSKTQCDVFRTVPNVPQYDQCYMTVINSVVLFLVPNWWQAVLNLVQPCYMLCCKYLDGATIIFPGLWPPRSPHQKFSDFSYWFNWLRANGYHQMSQSETLNSLHWIQEYLRAFITFWSRNFTFKF